jgi:hypothetical protein
MQEPGRKQKPFIKRRLTLIIAVLVVSAGVVILLLKSLNGPAEGTLSSNQTSASKTQSPKNQIHIYKGKYVSFTYPANYRVTSTAAAKGSLEGVNLYATNLTSKQVSVAVTQESLEQDSGVLLRRAHPETYHLESSTPGKVVFTSQASTYEIAQFMSQGGLVASIDISCPYKQDLRTDFDQISTSFKWN